MFLCEESNTAASRWSYILPNLLTDWVCVRWQVEDYEEEPLLKTGCKEYFWLLCKLIDNIHVKDASQVGIPSPLQKHIHTHTLCQLSVVNCC